MAGDRRRAERAIEAVFRTDLLIGRSDGDRFEISAAIEVLLPLSKLQDLLAWLRQQGSGDAEADAAGPDRAGTDGLGKHNSDHGEDEQ
jgi:hypothetical protein